MVHCLITSSGAGIFHPTQVVPDHLRVKAEKISEVVTDHDIWGFCQSGSSETATERSEGWHGDWISEVDGTSSLKGADRVPILRGGTDVLRVQHST